MALGSRDVSDPVITSDRDVLEIPCEYTQEQLMEGLTASDAEDGDLTDQIVAGSFSRLSRTECAALPMWSLTRRTGRRHLQEMCGLQIIIPKIYDDGASCVPGAGRELY